VIDSTFQDQLARTRTATALARSGRTRNALLILVLLLAVAVLVLAFAYVRVVDHYANNVRVAWVKLSPNGDGYAEYLDDGGQADRYFDKAVYGSLTNYLTWRFRVEPKTIDTDYGNASTFLGPIEASKFLTDFKAAEKARDAVNCVSCARAQVTVRGLDNTLLKPAQGLQAAIYKTAAFITVTQRDAGGGLLSRTNQIVSLEWTLRPASEASQGPNLDRLAVNPLSIEIISQDEREDKA
jgi:hypothetical protein